VEKYSPEEVKKLIAMLQRIFEEKIHLGTHSLRLEKQIKYLQQRYKFFNPTRDMLDYLIRQAATPKAKLDPTLLQKLKDEFQKKTP